MVRRSEYWSTGCDDTVPGWTEGATTTLATGVGSSQTTNTAVVPDR